jgi:hypothetical protein
MKKYFKFNLWSLEEISRALLLLSTLNKILYLFLMTYFIINFADFDLQLFPLLKNQGISLWVNSQIFGWIVVLAVIALVVISIVSSSRIIKLLGGIFSASGNIFAMLYTYNSGLGLTEIFKVGEILTIYRIGNFQTKVVAFKQNINNIINKLLESDLNFATYLQNEYDKGYMFERLKTMPLHEVKAYVNRVVIKARQEFDIITARAKAAAEAAAPYEEGEIEEQKIQFYGYGIDAWTFTKGACVVVGVCLLLYFGSRFFSSKSYVSTDVFEAVTDVFQQNIVRVESSIKDHISVSTLESAQFSKTLNEIDPLVRSLKVEVKELGSVVVKLQEKIIRFAEHIENIVGAT